MTVVINIVVSVIAMILLQLVGMVIFNWMTPYRDMDELKKGNVAVALALGGKFWARRSFSGWRLIRTLRFGT